MADADLTWIREPTGYVFFVLFVFTVSHFSKCEPVEILRQYKATNSCSICKNILFIGHSLVFRSFPSMHF